MGDLCELPEELRFLLLYLLEAAKLHELFSETRLLDEALPAITPAERQSLQEFLPHINVDYVLSSAGTFTAALASHHLAPIVFISPAWLLKVCPRTRLDTRVVSELLVDDLVARLETYLTDAPTSIRLGLYSAWLKAQGGGDGDGGGDATIQMETVLADCICGSNAPLLQKLVQMIGDASAASTQLQVVKDRIRPMSDRELALVLDDADVSDLFASFDTVSVAAGSIGQGHLARLVDGTEVFVKVKRYGVAELMREEAKLFGEAPSSLSSSSSSSSSTDRTPRRRTVGTSPWQQMADNLIEETSFATEVENQRKLKGQWTLAGDIHIVDIVAHHPTRDPTVLIMRVAPGTTVGRASIRFPIGLKNAVDVLNAFIQQFYANTLFYDAGGKDGSPPASSPCGFSPADPHAANEMIHVDLVTGAVRLTVIDTASICTITRAQRDQIVDLFVAVVMSDVEGIAEVLGIPYADVVAWTTACAVYRHIVRAEEKGGGGANSIAGREAERDNRILRKLVRIVEATKLVLKRPALDDLLLFGKAQLQLLDTVAGFRASHAYEMDKLGLRFDSLTQVITSNLMLNHPRNRDLARRAAWAVTAGAGRRFKDSFTAWDWEADGRQGNKTWPFGA